MGISLRADLTLIDGRLTPNVVVHVGRDGLIEEIDSLMKAQGVGLHHLEGTHEGGWVLMDFGDVIVHILTPDEREFYDLERVWPKAVELVRLQ